MSPPLNEDLVQRVNDLGTTPWSGTAYRYTTLNRDPLRYRSPTERWTVEPAGAFAVIYLACPEAA